jgi:hypothetical protein
VTSACELCGEAGPIHSRNHGFDLCEPCAAGYVAGRLHALGAELTVEEIEVVDSRDGRTLRGVRVKATMAQMLPLIAHVERATWKLKLLRALDRRRFRSSDPLLDARVSITTRTPELLRPLLARDGFQSALMSLASSCHEGFWIRPGCIELRAVSDDLDPRAEVPLAVAAMLRYLSSG